MLTESRTASFRAIHAEAAGRVAQAAAAAGTGRLVHVSAIGADAGSDSRYAVSKAEGEAAVRAAFPNATILRPSLVFGPEDNFFNRFAGLARLLPFLPVIEGATRMQPVYAGDVADAAMAALRSEAGPAGALGKTYELGGPRDWLFVDLLAYILKTTGRDLPLVNMPVGLVRLQALVLEHLPGKLLTRDQLRLLAHDNVVRARRARVGRSGRDADAGGTGGAGLSAAVSAGGWASAKRGGGVGGRSWDGWRKGAGKAA